MMLLSRRKIHRLLLPVLAMLLLFGSVSARHVKKSGRVKEKHHRHKTPKNDTVKYKEQRKTGQRQAELAKGKPVVNRLWWTSLRGIRVTDPHRDWILDVEGGPGGLIAPGTNVSFKYSLIRSKVISRWRWNFPLTALRWAIKYLNLKMDVTASWEHSFPFNVGFCQ